MATIGTINHIGANRSKPRIQHYNTSRGGALPEAVIVMAPLMVIMFCGFYLFRLYFVRMKLEAAAYDAVQATGLVSYPSSGNRSADIAQEIVTRFAAQGVTVSPAAVGICPVSNLTCTTNSVGFPDELFVIRVDIPTSIPYINQKHPLVTVRVTTIGANE
jgi:Flp pilus assembly protein TadG